MHGPPGKILQLSRYTYWHEREAISAGADEAIIYNIHGYVSEGCGDNIFLVQKWTICSRRRSMDALAGITRHTIVELARKGRV